MCKPISGRDIIYIDREETRLGRGLDKLAEYFGDFVEKANRNKAA